MLGRGAELELQQHEVRFGVSHRNGLSSSGLMPPRVPPRAAVAVPRLLPACTAESWLG